MLQAAAPPPAPPAPPAPSRALPAFAPPPPPGLRQPVRAKANLGLLINERDYPAAALRNHEEGATGFRLSVGKDGMVTDCAISASSGSASLDNTTCRLLTERARFTPARNSFGQATTDLVSGRIVWRLPNLEPMPFEPALFVDTMRATPAGEVTCTTARGEEAPESSGCPWGVSHRMAARARATGRVQQQVLVMTWTPAGRTELADKTARGIPAAEKDALVTIGADGSVIECRVTREVARGTGAGRAAPFDLCEDLSPSPEKAFVPAAAPGAPRILSIRAKAYVDF